MSAQVKSNPENRSYRAYRLRRLTLFSIFACTILLFALGINGRVNPAWSSGQIVQITSTSTKSISSTPKPTYTASATTAPPTSTPSSTITIEPTMTMATRIDSSSSYYAGTIILSLLEVTGKHLFAYNPEWLPFTRITNGTWDDIAPAASPDGTRLAFASNRDGFWDLYILDLVTGQTTRVTHTPEFDSNPSWSPDSQWLVYETYANSLEPNPQQSSSDNSISNFDLFILQLSVESSVQGNPIRLTNSPAADITPSWSPGGRQIAFSSNRTGEYEIWLADLDRTDDRFRNISQNPTSDDKYPTWAPDGGSLAWSSNAAGYRIVIVSDISSGNQQPQLLGAGEHPVWSLDNDALFTIVNTPSKVYLTGYLATAPGLALPPVNLPGIPSGLTWSPRNLDSPLPDQMHKAANAILEPITQNDQNSRKSLVELVDVEVTHALLSDMVDGAYNDLREDLAAQIGWDYLSVLENAFVPLTSPLFPGMVNDWLYTGRAIMLNTAPVNAGWMVAMREDFGSEVYWRIFLRTRFQDGSQGMPLYDLPWNFNSRSSGDPLAYEQGGALFEKVPPGFWFDFTQLAMSKGWERLPALITWRSAIPAARYNEYVFRNGLDWLSAMGEIYPSEALYTPTPVAPPTHSPTPTRWPTRTPIPTRTPWPTRTASPTP